jgi:hypothetical protein
MQRRWHEVSDEGVELAVEAPPEPPHPHELNSGAQPLPTAESDKRVGRRLALKQGRVKLVRVGKDAGVHVHHARCPKHLPPLGDEVAIELDVLER